MNPTEYLDNSDSYNFFKLLDDDNLIMTGHTGTNVMDVQILWFSKIQQFF